VGARAIGLDVGGTRTGALLVAAHGEILDRRTVATRATDPEAIIGALVEGSRELLTGEVLAVGVGAAGMVDREGVIRYGPNVDWRDLDLGADLTAALGLPCLVDNDANAAAWGEFRVGAGRDADDMLAITVGTGIGGGIVSAGKLFRGAHGFAAEVGHIIVEPGGPLCGCGNLGCLEQVASGRAITRAGREAVSEHPNSLLARLAEGDPDGVTGGTVTRAAQQGDSLAKGILAVVGRRLGEGIAGLVNVLDPELVVVGGGAIEAGNLLLAPARSAFLDAVEAPEHRREVPILPAQLENDAGAVGAALLALEELIP
jgi:glucokinase